MSPKLVELALRKQRLQLHIEMQRQDMEWRFEGLAPVFGAADRIREGAHWAKEHVPLLGGVALLLVALKPRLAFRVGRRAWGGWRAFQRISLRVAPVIALVTAVREGSSRH